MNRFVNRKEVVSLPRIPLRGTLNLTYRCDNGCRQCWLRLPPSSGDAAHEPAAGENEAKELTHE